MRFKSRSIKRVRQGQSQLSPKLIKVATRTMTAAPLFAICVDSGPGPLEKSKNFNYETSKIATQQDSE